MPREQEQVTEKQQAVLDFLRTCPGATYEQVGRIEESCWHYDRESRWIIGRGAATTRLKALERKGLVEAIVGIDKLVRWSLVEGGAT